MPFALIGLTRSLSYNIIQSYSQALNMPIITPFLTRGAEHDSYNYEVCLYPSFVQPVIDFIKYFQWERVFYLFDTDDALWRLQRIYKAFNHSQFLVDAIRIPDVSNSRDVLRKFDRNYNFPTKTIIVDLSSTEAYNAFLSQIIDVGMNRDGYHYVLGTLAMLDLEDLWGSFSHGGVNITGFQLINRQTHHYRKVKMKINQDVYGAEYKELSLEVGLAVDAIDVLTNALRNVSFETRRCEFHNTNHTKGINCSADPVIPFRLGNEVLAAIKSVDINGISGEHISFDKWGRRRNYHLDVYHLSFRSKLKKVGDWSDMPNGQVRNLRIELPTTRKDPETKLPNRTRIVTTKIESPFVIERRSINGKPLVGNERYEGYCIDLAEELSQRINFTYTIQLVKDQNYGRIVDGSWNGIIAELLTNEADIAIAALTITEAREKVVDFTKPYMNTGISLMIKKPENEKPGFLSFMQPLSYKVWLCITMGFLGVSLIFYMVGRLSPYEWQRQDSDCEPSDSYSLPNTLWFSLGALMQQGPDMFPRSFSGRVLGSVWWFFTLIIVSSYTANLAAFLTFEKLTVPINSVDDLVDNSHDIKYGLQTGGTTETFFRDSQVVVYRKMWKFMNEHADSVYVTNSDMGWEKVKNGKGKYAFLLESAMNNYYNQRKPCKTMKVGRNLDQKGYGVATPKGSDIRQPLNIAILEMREYGDLLKLEQKWWISKGQCPSGDSGEKGKRALHLSNVSGIFHILIGGLALALVASLSRVLFHKKIKDTFKKGTYRLTRGKDNIDTASSPATVRIMEPEELEENERV
ncbi:hypothetical protein ACJMK2_031597 [Sinanodonta woodiana]|uniref:Glutamate receptor n=1 Tax=Sinanodonta woodiana TaxID=1069815 RepID=A0ABD3X124_SINWO